MNRKEWLRAGGGSSVLIGLAFALALLGAGVSDEVPVGSLGGTVSMAENGRYLPGATLILRPESAPADYRFRTRIATSDANGNFEVPNLPAGLYAIEASSQAHTLERSLVYVAEGKPTTVDLALQPNLPFLDVYESQHVFTPKERPELHVRGFVQDDRLEINVYRVKREAIERTKNLREILSPLASDYQPRDPKNSPDVEISAALRWPIRSRNVEGVFDERVALPNLPRGSYFVEVRTSGGRRGSWLLVSQLATIAKAAGRQLLVYATDIETGRPVSGARLSTHTSTGKQEAGLTGADGTASLSLPDDQRGDGGDVAIVAEHNGNIAVCSWYQWSPGGQADGPKIWVYTDRPIYRPGNVVHFKGIARRLDGSEYRLPGHGTTRLTVRDPDGQTMHVMELPTSGNGCFSGSFTTQPEVTGSYQLLAEFQGGTSTSYVEVAAYRKSEFKITVTPLQASYVRGDLVRMKVKCEYYFGGPVPGAKLQASVYAAPVWPIFDPAEGDDIESEGYSDYLGEYVKPLDGETDANGECVLTLPTNADTGPLTQLDSTDLTLNFDVYAQDADAKGFSGQGSVRVNRGEFAVTVEPEAYVGRIGNPLRFQVRTTDNAGAKSMPDVVLQVEAGYRFWRRNETEFVPANRWTVRSDSEGRSTITATPGRPGEFEVRVTARDARGNQITSVGYVWIVGAGQLQWTGPTPQLQIIPDRRTYRPGDTATVAVRTAKPGGHALLTVEGSRVKWAKVVALNDATTDVQIPIQREFGPNAFIAVAYVREKQFFEAVKGFQTDTSFQRIQVSVTPDRSVAEPGSTVRYAVKTTGADGTPVPAEFSFSVVDEAIYAIAPDNADPFKAFYPRVVNQVVTSYSFPELYLDGGDKGGGAPVRRTFLDTAFWEPNGRTDDQGHAEVTVRLPDNLTTWRATAIAVTDSTAVGKGTASVRCRKPLIVRLSAPAFLVASDQVQVTTTVHNETGRRQEIRLDLALEGATASPSEPLSIALENGEQRSTYWNITVGDAEVVTLRASATASGGPADAMEMKVPILAHGRRITATQAGEVDRELALTISRVRSATHGKVKLTLASSLAGPLLDSIQELVDYPYGCTEQTMSRFMPAVVVLKAVRELGMNDPELEAKIADVAQRSQARLRTLQHYSGGFGWFAQDPPHARMTALVLEGLWRCEQAGLPTDRFIRDRALTWAIETLRQHRIEPKTPPQPSRATPNVQKDIVGLAFAVLLWTHNAEAERALRGVALAHADTETLAAVAMGAGRLGQAGADLTRAALSALHRTVTQSGATAWWPTEPLVLSTARALQALAELEPDDPLIPKIIRFAMAARRGNAWDSTMDTGMMLVGISATMARQGAPEARSEVRIKLGGKVVATRTLRGLKGSANLEWAIREFPDGDTRLEIERSGTGPLYYSVETYQTPNQPAIGALVNNSGLTVERSFHLLEARRFEDGQMRLMPRLQAATTFRTGDLVRCTIHVQATRQFEFVVLEVPVPANCRITESDAEPDTWDWWWSSTTVLDDKVAFFVRTLPRGRHSLQFNLRAEAAGVCTALPPDGFEMYAPQYRGSSAAQEITVVR